MNLMLNTDLGNKYKRSNSQKAKAMTEAWISENFNCPFCNVKLSQYSPNNKCADFYCKKCNEDFELKSVKGKFSKSKIIGAEYNTTIEKIKTNNSNWLLLERNDTSVTGLTLIPKYFFYEDMIEERKPLSDNAKRKGWKGCMIRINMIPSFGKVQYITNSKIINKKIVKYKLDMVNNFKNVDIKNKNWKLIVLSLIDSMPENIFSAKDLYEHIDELKIVHPNNNYIDAKIRQTLQYLRDEGYVKFLDSEGYKGLYKKLF